MSGSEASLLCARIYIGDDVVKGAVYITNNLVGDVTAELFLAHAHDLFTTWLLKVIRRNYGRYFINTMRQYCIQAYCAIW